MPFCLRGLGGRRAVQNTVFARPALKPLRLIKISCCRYEVVALDVGDSHGMYGFAAYWAFALHCRR
eukprot:4116691-Amphidinium_carterae.1